MTDLIYRVSPGGQSSISGVAGDITAVVDTRFAATLGSSAVTPTFVGGSLDGNGSFRFAGLQGLTVIHTSVQATATTLTLSGLPQPPASISQPLIVEELDGTGAFVAYRHGARITGGALTISGAVVGNYYYFRGTYFS